MATKGKGAIDPKPLCQFGENCYRRNPQHFQQFRHPKRKVEEEEQLAAKKKKNEPKKIDKYFKTAKKSDDKEGDDADTDSTARGSDTAPDVPNTEAGKDSDKEVGKEEEEFEEEEDVGDSPASPASIRENVKQKFMVDMPEDFYDFWEFCKTENPKKPEDALLKPLGFQLVGPYDILAGKHKGITKNKDGKRVNFLLHWRYYYDPPEFQTVIKGDDSKQFHIGYFRFLKYDRFIPNRGYRASLTTILDCKKACAMTASYLHVNKESKRFRIFSSEEKKTELEGE